MEILRRTALFKLEQQTKDVPIEDVTELHFTTLPLLSPTHLQPFHCLRKLSLVSLKPALKQFWDVPIYLFPNLVKLDLSDNKITGFCGSSDTESGERNASTVSTQVAEAARCEWERCASVYKQPSAVPIRNLKRLHVVNNAVEDEHQLRALAVLFPELDVLDIADNPAASLVSRDALFALWPTLNALDSTNRSGEQIEVLETDDDEESDEDEEESDEDEEESDDVGESSHVDDDELALNAPVKKCARTEPSS